jgi:hypothetical protein
MQKTKQEKLLVADAFCYILYLYLFIDETIIC